MTHALPMVTVHDHPETSHSLSQRQGRAATYLLYLPEGLLWFGLLHLLCIVLLSHGPFDDCLFSVQLLLTAPCPSSNPPLVVPKNREHRLFRYAPTEFQGPTLAEDCSILLTKVLFHEGRFILTLGIGLLCFKNYFPWSQKP